MDEYWRSINEKDVKEFADNMTSEFLSRREVGIKKYGTSFVGDAQRHQREEILDALFYNWAANQEREYLLNKIEEYEFFVQILQNIINNTKMDEIVFGYGMITEKIEEFLKENENAN